MEPEERRQARFNDDIAAATRESVETFMNQRLTELGQQLKTQQGTIVQQQNALQQMSTQRNFQANQVGQIAQNQSALHQSVTCQAGQVGQVVQNQEALHRSVAAQIESVVQSPVRKRATVPLQAIGADQQLEQLILQQQQQAGLVPQPQPVFQLTGPPVAVEPQLPPVASPMREDIVALLPADPQATQPTDSVSVATSQSHVITDAIETISPDGSTSSGLTDGKDL